MSFVGFFVGWPRPGKASQWCARAASLAAAVAARPFVGLPKNKASRGPVPLHPLLSEFMFRWNQKTPYSQPEDWVFPSFRLNGKQPREDHLAPAAVNAGVLSSCREGEGRLVDL